MQQELLIQKIRWECLIHKVHHLLDYFYIQVHLDHIKEVQEQQMEVLLRLLKMDHIKKIMEAQMLLY